jgi:DNA helicase-2/ATP-dependent DNA helicase PcrA
MLSGSETVRKKWQQRFKYVMIDEYQDTNSAQYKLIKLLVGESRNIAVVGDDWQSIYSWRGADFKNILNFEKDYKNAAIIKLEQNYRSTQHILEAAHKVISTNTQRSEKNLWTSLGDGMPVQIVPVGNERAEAEAIARRAENSVAIGAREYGDFAVLYRTNAQSRVIEDMFLRYGLPYKIVGGVRFYDRKEIRDIVGYVRLIFQPEDHVSFERIVNVPARGIGVKSISNFREWQRTNGLSLYQALQDVNMCETLTPKARSALSELNGVLTDLRNLADETNPAGLIDSLLRRIDYIDYLDDGTLQAETRIENVKELLSVARVYQDAGLEDFLEEVSLASDHTDSQGNNNKSSITLMTLHSAKGLEFPVVFMVGLEETILPHTHAHFDQRDMEEERRLCYVGMTRAKEELYMLYASSRVLYGSVQHNAPSRFLSEIDSKLSGPDPLSSEPAYVHEALPEPHYVVELHQGDLVRHSMFGVGTVVDMQDDIAVIDFRGKGSKKLNIAFAPIEKL